MSRFGLVSGQSVRESFDASNTPRPDLPSDPRARARSTDARDARRDFSPEPIGRIEAITTIREVPKLLMAS